MVYVDANKVNNTIIVSGDNVEAIVEGNSFSLQPKQNFSGETLVTVTVQDNEYESDSVSTSFTLTVIGTNDTPEAKVTTDTVQAKEGDVITLDASLSTDYDGDQLTYRWEGPGEISNADQAIANVTGLSVGEHNFNVTVSDGELESVASISVRVDAADSSTSSSGGSLGWFTLMLLGLAGLGRRQK